MLVPDWSKLKNNACGHVPSHSCCSYKAVQVKNAESPSACLDDVMSSMCIQQGKRSGQSGSKFAASLEVLGTCSSFSPRSYTAQQHFRDSALLVNLVETSETSISAARALTTSTRTYRSCRTARSFLCTVAAGAGLSSASDAGLSPSVTGTSECQCSGVPQSCADASAERI